jgi:hypothetical protein
MQETNTDLQGILVSAKSYVEDPAKLYKDSPRSIVFRLIEGKYKALTHSHPVIFDKERSPYPNTRFYSLTSLINVGNSQYKIDDVEKFFIFLRFEFIAPKLASLTVEKFVEKVISDIGISFETIGLSRI